MHEWALADSVITAALEFSKDNKFKKVSVVNVVFGELQAIDKEIFTFAIKELLSSSEDFLKKAKFKILDEEALFKCRVCGADFSLKDVKKTEEEAEYIHFIPEMAHTYIKCLKCGSPDFEIVKGRGIYIKDIKGEK